MNEVKSLKRWVFVLFITNVLLLGILIGERLITPVHAQIYDRGEEVLKVQIVSIDESPDLRWEAIPVTIE